MKGKRTLGAAWLVLFAFMFVFAVTGCSSVSTISDDSSWESRLTAATTFGEVARVYWDAPEGSEAEKVALEKLKTILKSRLAAATTLEEVRGVYWDAPYGSEVRKAAAEKLEAILTPILAAATTREEVWGVYVDAPYGSEVKKAAAEKLEELER